MRASRPPDLFTFSQGIARAGRCRNSGCCSVAKRDKPVCGWTNLFAVDRLVLAAPKLPASCSEESALRRTHYDVAAAIIAALCALIYAISIFGLKAFLDPGRLFHLNLLWPLHFALAAMTGTTVASFLIFPYLSGAPGIRSIITDIGRIALAVLVATMIAGALIIPPTGIVLAPLAALVWLAETPALGLIYAGGTVAALCLARSKMRQHQG